MSHRPNPTATKSSRLESLTQLLTSDWRTLLAYMVAVGLYVAAIFISSGYANIGQFFTLLNLAAFLGIVAIGQTFVILIFGIDLSVSAVITLVSIIISAYIDGSNERTLIAIPLALVIGAAVGLINGAGIWYLKIPDLVMTLATFSILTGGTLLYSNGSPTGRSSDLLGTVATGRLGGTIPWSVIVWASLAALAVFVLHRTTIGRHVYAVGFNRRASRFSGVRVGRTVIVLYTISGITAALAGLLITGYTGQSFFGIGDPYQLGSIAAVVVGGTSIFGGRGGYVGTIAGAFTIVLLQSVLRTVNIADAGRDIAYGLVILVLLIAYGRARSLRE